MNDLFKKFIKINEFYQWDYNEPLTNLPNLITTLTFGEHFNQSVDNLPNSIMHLTFDDNFSQPINKLPNKIKSIMLNNAHQLINKNCLVIHNGIKNHVIYNLNKNISTCINDYFELLDNSKGKIIFENLTIKVFCPLRINKLSNKYNIDFDLYFELI